MLFNTKLETKYNIGGLRNKIYLIPFDDAINRLMLDDEEPIFNGASIVLDSSSSIFSLNVDSVSYQTENLDGNNNSFKFKHTLSCSLNETENVSYYQNIVLALQNDFMVVFENENYEKYILNAEFAAHFSYNYSFNDSSASNTLQFTFTVNQNIPTIALITALEVTEELNPRECKDYTIGKISSLKLLVRDASQIKADGGDYSFEVKVTNTTSSPYEPTSIADIEWLDGSFEMQEQYDGDTFNQSITFSIPFEHYINYFHYSLLEFSENKYYAVVETTNGNQILFGYMNGLLPSYTIVSSTATNSPNKINITLELVNDEYLTLINDSKADIEEVTTIITYREEDVRCINHKPTKTLLRKYLNGEPTSDYYCLEGWEDEYKGKHIVDTYQYDSIIYGIKIVESTYCREESDCLVESIRPQYTVQVRKNTTFDIAYKCPLSFSIPSELQGKIRIAISDNKLTFHIGDAPSGQYTITALDENGDKIKDVILIITNSDKNYAQSIDIDYKPQRIQVKPRVDISGASISSSIPYEINDDVLVLIFDENTTQQILENMVTIINGYDSEVVNIYQNYKTEEEVFGDTYYRWAMDTDMCISDSQQYNCERTVLNEDETICIDGNLWSTVREEISLLCDGDYRLSAIKPFRMIEPNSTACKKETNYNTDALKVAITYINRVIEERYFPQGIIRSSEFEGNEGIEIIDIIGTDLYRIASRAFADCPNLKTVYINTGIQEIAEEAFADCPNLDTVHYRDTLENLEANIEVDSSAFDRSGTKCISTSDGQEYCV